MIFILSFESYLDQLLCFRIQNIQERKRYVSLVDSVKDCGGDVKVFSSMHVSGERKLYFISV